MSVDVIAGIAFTALCGLLGVIWWEIKGIRKSIHALVNRITVIIGKVSLLSFRVKKLERKADDKQEEK